MQIGALRHRIELQSVSCTPDGMGGQTDSYTTEATVYASIWPVTAKELLTAGSLAMVGTHKVRIRYYPDIKASWRVKFGTRYFSIVSIANLEERNVQIDLLCREVLA